MKTLSILTLLVFFSFAGCGGGDDDPIFCDETTDCELPDKPFCDIDKLYSAALTNECTARPDPTACNRVQPCTDPAKPKCDSIDVGTKGTCVECTSDTDCPDATCDSTGTCVGFSCTPGGPGGDGDRACLAADNTKPICVVPDTCGECNGTNPAHCEFPESSVCDIATYTCRGCMDHDECSSEACDIDANTCIDGGFTVDVAAGGIDSAVCGIPSTPCATIAFALNNHVDATRNVVIVAPGNYSEPLVIADETVTIIGKGNPVISTVLDGATPAAVTVSGTASLTLDGISVIPASGTAGTDAIVCTGAGATLSVTRATVGNAEDLGIVADNCSLTLSQSTVSGNGGGGVQVTNADYSIINNFFIDNGGNSTVVSGVRIEGTIGQTEELSFNTFARNSRSGVDGFALICDGSDLVATNNIFMLTDASSQGLITSCATTYSLFDAESSMDTGTGNISANANFVNPGADDYHLMAGSPGVDVADPAATIDVDIDREGRPANGRSDMGADEVQ